MTIDKIKHYMHPVIFNHWAECQDIEVIKLAASNLEREMKDGILQGIQYHAELNFLQIKLG